jgi:ATP-dependent DNA helicase PIF1
MSAVRHKRCIIAIAMLQKEALDILKLGRNVFLTGAAGSGKTHTLRAYINYLYENNVEVAITASTGIAATHIGGVTIHSWSGLGIRDRLTEYDIEMMEEKQNLWKRYQNTKVLIIDEISMLHHFRFDMLDRLARALKRKPDLPFGGMQVVLCGDFFQLPPVHRQGEQPAFFAYQSDIWKKMNLKVCYLSEQHRQNDDSYLSLLNDIRGACVEDDSLQYLRDRYKKDIDPALFPDIVPTKLYSHNADVDAINDAELEKLGKGWTPGNKADRWGEQFFLMDTKGKASLVDALVKSCLAPMELRLRVGARVMFVRNNQEKGYANGTLGVVVGFDTGSSADSSPGANIFSTGSGVPIIRIANGREIHADRESWIIEEDGKIKAEISQIPLRLAWAITIHKSQGMSLDAAEIDLSKSFVAGMGYVALSRVKSLAGLKLVGFSHNALQIHPEILEFDRELKRLSDQALGELTEIMEGDGEKSLKDMQMDFLLANGNPHQRGHGGKGNGMNGKGANRQGKKGKAKFDENGNVIPGDPYEKTEKIPAHQQTKLLLLEKKSLADMAKARNIKEETVLSHIEKLIQDQTVRRENIDLTYLRNHAYKNERSRLRFARIKDAFIEEYERLMDDAGDDEKKQAEAKLMRLAPIKHKLGNSYSYAEIGMAKVFVMLEM